MLRADGYDAVGVDPDAPEEPQYLRVVFEEAKLPESVDALVASASLHHVADPAAVFDRIANLLEPAGKLVVVEWDWASFDEPTSEWCFARLDPDGETWLHRRRDAWIESGEPWRDYFTGWAAEHGLHDVSELLRLLGDRFEQLHLERGPYFFPALAATTEADELAAISDGLVRPGRVDYVGSTRLRSAAG
jgi:SAM-dependent methyltransferase